MRVIAGRWKGRSLVAPAGRGTRPTSDKVREAMFDVLGALPAVRGAGVSWREADARDQGPLAGHAVLDLFAGSGALGLEALSRGADSCTFVEHDRAAVSALRANLERLGVPARRAADPVPDAAPESAARARVVAGDVRRALQADARRGARYTLVFADPPYDRYADVRPALARLLGALLAPGAALVVETAAGTPALLPWTIVREKRYGDTQVTFLVAEGTSCERGAERDNDASPA